MSAAQHKVDFGTFLRKIGKGFPGLLFWLLVLLLGSSRVYLIQAQTGPAGIGNETSNVLWLRAGDIQGIASGDSLDIAWPDTSGNQHHASQSTIASQPLFLANRINGYPSVQFDGIDDLLDDVHSYTGRSGFIIYKVNPVLMQSTDLGQVWGSYGEGAHVAMDARAGNLQGFSFDGDQINTNRARYAIDGMDYGSFVANDNNPAWVYDSWELVSFEFEVDRPITRQVLGSLVPNFAVGEHQYGGEVAEIIIFNSVLNDAQRIIVENYLSGKYNIDISASGNDYYSFESTHPYGISGIGRADVSNIHMASYSAKTLQAGNPSGLDADDEYLFFGHDGGDMSTWTDTELPAGNNIQRLSREWRFEETGELDGITFTLDTTLLPARNTGYTKYVLLVDADGDFSSGALAYEMSSPGGDEYFQATNIDISSGSYVAIGAVIPTISFLWASQYGSEASNDTIEFALNYLPINDVSVDYYTTDGTAIAPGDYTAVVSATAIIAAGTDRDSMLLQLVNDTDVESDENLSITLNNPSAGVNIGTYGVLNYTIHDDDNPRKIYFTLGSSSGSEGTTPVSVAVQITPSEFDPFNTTTVDYLVTGGTATGGGVDYTLASGTLSIPPLSISNTFSIDIVDDPMAELPETIEITLQNPGNGNLSATDPITYTYTINDNDNAPFIQFGTISSEGDEGSVQVKIPVNLSSVSSQDVVVDYQVSGTATPFTDHDLNDNSLTIPAGALSDTIYFTVTDDAVIEWPETVVITLQSSPVNGILGSIDEHTYTIVDNDAEPGFSGPGGVGDSLINELWLAADQITGLSDGDPLSVAWPDISGNAHDASQSTPGYYPGYETGEINGLPVVRFDGIDDYLQNSHSYSGRTVFAVYSISSGLQDGGELAQIWGNYDEGVHLAPDPRSGSNVRGWSFDGNAATRARYALFGEDYTAGYYEDDNSVQWSYDQAQMVAAEFESTSAINTQVIGSLVPAFAVGAHQYGGDIAELIVYNNALNTAQRILVENYLAAKYNLDISPAGIDYFSYEGTHGFQVAGIGREDPDNLHLAAQSGGLIKISDPSGLDNGEYILFGHDNASLATWNNLESPADSIYRIDREWRFDNTGDPGDITLAIDTTMLPALPDGYRGYGILLDADGDFTGSSSYFPLSGTGSAYEISLLDIPDGSYLTIAIIGPSVNFELAASVFGESAGTVPVIISLSDTLASDVSVDFIISGGTATAGGLNDYTISSSPVTISAGSISDTIFVTLNNDSEIESGETVIIDINGVTGNASLGQQLQHTLLINDDDFSGYTGPGGVGESSINTLWLKADVLTLSNGDPVTNWIDTSGNNNDALGLSAGHEPDYITNVINSHPVVRFDDSNDEYLGANLSLGISGSDPATVFLVARNQENTDEDNTGLFIGDLAAGGGDIRHYGLEHDAAVRFNNGNRVFDDGYLLNTWKLGTFRNFAGAQYGQFEFYADGVVRGQVSSSGSANVPTTVDDLFYIGAGRLSNDFRSSRYFTGDMTEVIVYNTYLNEAQRIIVENYLAARYYTEITIANDRYQYDATHGHDVAGIGRVDASNLHTMAQSDGILRMGSASDLGDDEYLLFGHDNTGMASWSAAEVPGDSVLRIQQEWRLDETGDVGQTGLFIDTTRLPVKPAGYTAYVIWMDDDGDFSSGSTQINLTRTAEGYASGLVNFNDGAYLALGIVRPVIQFSQLNSNGDESEEGPFVRVSLNYTLATEASVAYRVDGSGTASGGGVDYTLADGLINIPAGSLYYDIPFSLVDDADPESDETVVLVLESPGEGISLGPDSIHTYTIQDNDNVREIDFTIDASSSDEAVSPIFLTLRLNQADPVNPTSVDYTVIGGSALNSVDYTLVDGTAIVSANEISTTISIVVVDDNIYETDETILVELSNPVNANLGVNQTRTHTILDNEVAPELEFISSSYSGSEHVSPSQVSVGLTAPAGEDVTVEFSVTGGTATGGGVDYTLADGILVIPAGDTLGLINIVLIDDSQVELEETISLSLANVSSNAVLGTRLNATFTINDNDFTGFTGPGGVGDDQINKLWLSADTLVSVSGSDVTTWGDASGNANHAQNLAPGQEPDLVSGVINGLEVVSFDDNGGTNGDYLGANVSLGISGSGPATVFIVARNTTSSDEDNTGLFIGQATGSGGTVRHYGLEYGHAVRFNNGNRIFDDGFVQDAWRIGMIRNASGFQYGQYEGYIDGVELGQSASTNPGNDPITADDFYYLGAGLGTGGTFSANRYFEGDMAEVIAYNAYLNDAQRIIVENYLSSKYGLAVANDFYSFDVIHGHDVAGIGREDASNIHTAAQSAGILKFSNANSLDDGEYLLFGHDNHSYSAWTLTEVPGSNIQRIRREWRVDLSGDPGTLTLAVDTSLLEAKPSNYNSLILLVDSDGDFTSGADFYPMELVGSEYQVSQLSLNDGDYISIGVIRVESEFTLASSNGPEDVTPVEFSVELNYTLSQDYTIDYTISGGSATGGGVDYLLSDGTVQIPAGSLTGIVSVTIVDDFVVEPDETIVIELSNPSLGYMGVDSVHTHTINDNDNPRVAEFATSDSAHDEGISPVLIKVLLSNQNPVEDSKIAYRATGGDATGGGIDYSLPSDTLVIPMGDTVGYISLQITDDSMDEPDEEIIIELVGTGSLYLNLGTNTIFRDTVLDNDLPPEVQFASVTASGAESFQTVNLPLELSAISGLDVEVDYSVTGGSATSGIDYVLTSGTLMIPSGESSGSIQFSVVDDTDEEGTESINVNLSNPDQAVLGGNTSIVYSILDDDGLGYEGPGGVANFSTQNKVWLNSVLTTGLSDGNPVSIWNDVTGNNHNATQSGSARPTYLNNGADNWNGRPVVRFDNGFSQYMGIANHADLNTGGPYDKKTIILAFRTGTDINTRQVLYEQGGGTRGLNIYIDGGQLYISGWNLANDDGGATTPWSFTSVTTALSSNTPYIAMLQFDFEGATGDVSGWVNGDLINILPGAGRLFDHPGEIGLGGMNNGSVFHDGADGGYDHYFTGNISELITNNIVYNTAQAHIVNNYLGAKYNISLTDDYYDHEVDFGWEVFGIGQFDNDNAHSTAQGSGMFRVDNPNSLDNSDYLLIGHNNDDITAWTNTDVPDADPNIQRIGRIWRADDRNNGMGTVRLGLDISDLPAQPFGFNTYVLLVNDNPTFASGSEVYELTFNASTGLYEVTDLDLSGDKCFTIGVVRPAIEFTLSSASGSEALSPVDVEVSLNYVSSAEFTVDYAVTGGTASNGADYNLAPGTATVLAGNQSGTFQLDIINDTDVESDETIEITLSNPGSGLILGNIPTFTYTINDDDNSRWIQFVQQDSSNLESIDTIEVSVHINQIDLINPTSVVYTATGGTATGGSVDYGLPSGTVVVPAGDSIASFKLGIDDDLLDETDETVEISLSSPLNANLGDTILYTYTIIDDDNAPSIEFEASTSQGTESFSPVRMNVTLSGASGQEIILYYSAIGGSAINGGIDYTIVNPSQIVIQEGSVLDSIEFSIFNDIIEETDETIVIRLDSAVNAALGGQLTHTYTIYDDDGMGWIGPGGVSSDGGYDIWLKSNAISGYADGARLNTWPDVSIAGNDGAASGTGPYYYNNGTQNVNDRPVAYYPGNNEYHAITNDNVFNTGGPYTRKSLMVAFQTGSDVSSRQVIYEQGGGTRGLNIYVEGGQLYIAGWNLADDDGGLTTPWGFSSVSSAIGANETHYALLEFNSDSSWINGYLDGNLIGTATGVGNLFGHSGDIGLGAMNNGSYFGSGSASGNGYYFGGKILEFLSFNRTLNEARKIIIENYFGAKYDISILNDRFAYDNGYDYEVFGIGRESNGNSHVIAQGSGIIRFDNPTSMNDGDYLIAGHDNGDIGTWTTAEIPFDSIQRVAREWRVGENGIVGNIRFAVDTTGFAANPVDYESFIIMIDRDGDSDFTTGSIDFYKLDQSFGELVRTNSIDFSDGDVFTIAVARNISVQTGDWDDPDTWLLGVPGDDEGVAIISTHVVSLTQDESIGNLTISAGAELRLGSNTLSVTQGTILNAGTFTAQTGTVEYSSGGSQCISPLNYYNLYLTGSGTKTLCGDVFIQNDIQILGIPGTLFLDVDPIFNYDIYLAGDWRSRGTFIPRQGDVILNGASAQQLLRDDGGDEEFYNFTVNTSGTVSSNHSLIIGGSLTMNGGNIDMGTSTLSIGSGIGQAGTLVRNTGSVIGEVRRWFNAIADDGSSKVFPVGTDTWYRPLIIGFDDVSNGGTLTTSFVDSDPGNSGLPLEEDGISIIVVFGDGYWPTDVANGLSFSGNYDLDLVADGFSGQPIDTTTRIISRLNSSSDWQLVGDHLNAIDTLIRRIDLSALPYEFGIGTVVDCEVSLSNCPADINQVNDPGDCGAIITWTPPTPSGTCAGVTMTSTADPGDFFPVGLTLVTYYVEDAYGNEDSCSFNVIVTDEEAPVITAPLALTLTCNQSTDHSAAILAWLATASAIDECDGSVLVTNDYTGYTQSCNHVITVQFDAVDAAGNNATSQSSTITFEDVTSPVLTIPADVAVECDAVPAVGTATATDDCDGDVTITYDGETRTDGACTYSYTLTRTWTATDDCGNITTRNQLITVDDTTAPTASNPANINVECISDVPVPDVSVVDDEADNCGVPLVAFVSDVSDGLSNPETITRTYSVTDVCGNSSNVTQLIVIQDVTPPVISSCPADITVPTDTSYCGAIVSWTAPTATDNCTVVLSSSHNPGDTIPVGTTTVTYTAIDGAGLIDLCTFDITVDLPAPPTISGPNDVCNPSTATYSVVDPGGNHTFQWTVTNGTIVGSDTNNTVDVLWNVSGPGSVAVDITSGSGCVHSNNMNVTVAPEALTGTINSSTSLNRR